MMHRFFHYVYRKGSYQYGLVKKIKNFDQGGQTEPPSLVGLGFCLH